MAISDAKPVPRKNEPYRLGFCIRDINYRLNRSWADPTAYISLDGSGFSNGNDALYFESAPVEIDGVGIGYVDITASGMNADLVMVRICNDSGIVFTTQYNAFEKIYPEEPGDYRCDIVQVNGLDIVDDGVVDANVVQVSGEPVSIDDFGGAGSSLTAEQVRAEMDANSAALIAISGNVAGLNGDVMRGTDNAALAINLTSVSGAIAKDVWEYSARELTEPVSVSGIVDANVVLVSGLPVDLENIVDANVIQVSGEHVHIDDFKADVSNISGDVNVVSVSGVPVSIDNNSIADSTELSTIGNLLLRSSRIVRLLP